jgi:hypothetical protein
MIDPVLYGGKGPNSRKAASRHRWWAGVVVCLLG